MGSSPISLTRSGEDNAGRMGTNPLMLGGFRVFWHRDQTPNPGGSGTHRPRLAPLLASKRPSRICRNRLSHGPIEFGQASVIVGNRLIIHGSSGRTRPGSRGSTSRSKAGSITCSSTSSGKQFAKAIRCCRSTARSSFRRNRNCLRRCVRSRRIAGD